MYGDLLEMLVLWKLIKFKFSMIRK
jgi:hypothetical protein